ncbi:hypothetical protein QBE52_16235 [Clostridiaceae bacterium 35-E11]
MKKYFTGLLGILILWIVGIGCNDHAIEKEIKNFVQTQERYVQERQIEDYMNTISKKETEYVAEKQSWIRDIQNNAIKDYRLEIKEMNILNKEKVTVNVIQSYKYQGQYYEMQIPLVLIKENGHWKDHDLMFEEIETKHFKIKYDAQSKAYAQSVAKICEKAYGNVFRRYGETVAAPITIKIYQDRERLRQSVKLSFTWQFAGWYEYPESIKTTQFNDEGTYKDILEHELIHKLTIQKSNNNLPYWFTEGLAVYFGDFPDEPFEYRSKEYYLNTYKDQWMNIEKLESKNLEKMKDHEEISNYYDSAGMIVKFMIESYGLEKVKQIVEALGKYPYQKGTGVEVDQKSIQRFHEVVPAVLGIDVKKLDKQWEKYLQIQ